MNTAEKTTAAHTPGPWVATRKAGMSITAADKRSVCAIPATVRRDRATIDANARLIAAAPDLAKACKNFIGFAEYHELEKANPRLQLQLLSMRDALLKAGAL